MRNDIQVITDDIVERMDLLDEEIQLLNKTTGFRITPNVRIVDENFIERRRAKSLFDDRLDEIVYDSNNIIDIEHEAENSLQLATLFDLQINAMDRGQYLADEPSVMDKITNLLYKSTSLSTQAELYEVYEEIYFVLSDAVKGKYREEIKGAARNEFEMRKPVKVYSSYDIHSEYGVKPSDFH